MEEPRKGFQGSIDSDYTSDIWAFFQIHVNASNFKQMTDHLLHFRIPKLPEITIHINSIIGILQPWT